MNVTHEVGYSAITHGISHLVGQVTVGTLADLVLWKPENFGAKPEMVIKSGVIAWAQVRSFPGHGDRKSTRLNSSHSGESRMPSSA